MVSQVPLISGHDNLRALVRSDFIAGFREMFDADRLVPAELAIAGFDLAHQPKELVVGRAV